MEANFSSNPYRYKSLCATPKIYSAKINTDGNMNESDYGIANEICTWKKFLTAYGCGRGMKFLQRDTNNGLMPAGGSANLELWNKIFTFGGWFKANGAIKPASSNPQIVRLSKNPP